MTKNNPYAHCKKSYEKILTALDTIEINLAKIGTIYNEFEETELEEDVKILFIFNNTYREAFQAFRAKMILGYDPEEKDNG